MNGLLTISEADLKAMVAERVAAMLSPAQLEVMAEAWIMQRIGVLTLDEAARRFSKPGGRAMLRFAHKHRIPVYEFSREDRYIMVKDIEEALRRRRVVVAEGGLTGTRVGAGKEDKQKGRGGEGEKAESAAAGLSESQSIPVSLSHCLPRRAA